LCTEVFADGIGVDFVCGDEVYGSCTQLRAFLEARGQSYVLRVASNFHLTVARGVKLTCKQAAGRLLAGGRHWEVRSAGKGSKGERWYAWALAATASPRHHLLIRRHLKTGELAFHYCYVPEGQPATTGPAGPRRWAQMAGGRGLVRHEALRCIPGAAGRNLEGGFWV
jgi:hypothetical protein